MAGRIPQSFIDELLARVNIVDVIGTRLTLKSHGTEHKACCPFHNEKTPSFTVSEVKQFYHCFGCQAHGSAIGFLMEYEQMEFVEAIETLAASLGLEVPREGDASSGEEDRRKRLYALLERCVEIYKRGLREHAEASDYLRERGLSGEIARDFAVGFAVDAWDVLVKELGSAARDDLVHCGLLVQGGRDGYYDRFRGRIMFPIRDARGRTIGFGGRAMGDATPKYMNSPESSVFHKRREVYGLHEARQAGLKEQPLIVVEGYLDVIALHQHGIHNAVATLGTAITDNQLQLLFRYTDELVLCLDGDAAGRRAAWRAMETVLPLMSDGREVRFLFLPDGADPDSFVRERDAAAFTALAQGALPLSDYLFNGLRERASLDTIAGRARFSELARPLLGKLPDGVYARLMREQLAREIGTSPGEPAGSTPAKRPARADPAPNLSPPSRMTPLRTLLALLLRDPQLHRELARHADILTSDQPGYALARKLLSQIEAAQSANAASLIERFEGDPDQSTLVRLANWEPPGEPDDARIAELFSDALERLRETRTRERSDELLALARTRALSEAEKEELNRLLKRPQ